MVTLTVFHVPPVMLTGGEVESVVKTVTAITIRSLTSTPAGMVRLTLVAVIAEAVVPVLKLIAEEEPGSGEASVLSYRRPGIFPGRALMIPCG